MPAACSRRTATRISFARAVRQIRRFRREEGERVVAPVVAQPALQHEAVLQEGMHRHQFDRGDAEPAQVIDHRGMRKGREGAALGWADVVVQHGQPAHMRLVDHGVRPRNGGWVVVAPVERVVGHHAFRHRRRAVAPVERQVAAQ